MSFLCAVLHTRRDFGEPPFLYLRFLQEVAGRPAVRERMKFSADAGRALLSIIMRAPGAPTLAAVLLLGQWHSKVSLDASAVRSAVLEVSRRVCDAQVLQSQENRGPDSANSLDCLALVHLRRVLSQQRTDQAEPLSRGARFNCLWSHGAFARQAHECPSMPHLAGAIIHAVASANAPTAPGAPPGTCWPPLLEDALMAGIPWVEDRCDISRSRQLLLAWVLDLSSDEAPGLLQGQPAAAAELLKFVEAELLSAGGLECLRKLLANNNLVCEAAIKRPRLMERLFTCCEATGASGGCNDPAKGLGIPLTTTERTEACHAITLLLQDTSAGQIWASRLLMLQGPARALRWASTGNIESASAYALVQCMVETGGAPIAREVWSLCKLTLESPEALQAALDISIAPNRSLREVSKVHEGREQWRSLLLKVLQETSDGADPQAWADKVETQALLKMVQSTSGDSSVLETSAALAELSSTALKASTAEAPHWPLPACLRNATKSNRGRSHILEQMDMAAASIVAQQWQQARAHRRERSLPCGIVTKAVPGAEPMVIDGPTHKKWHSGRGKKAHFLVSSPTRSPSRCMIDPELWHELNESATKGKYGPQHAAR